MTLDVLLEKLQIHKRQLLVWALIPFREDGFFDDYYDWRTTQAELDKALTELGLEWRWQPVKMSNVSEVVEQLITESKGRQLLVLNYCDGDEINGFPGISVVRVLEEKNLPFTGADARFYDISTSKIRMKELFEAAGVATAPFAVMNGSPKDFSAIFEKIGSPLFVKPSVSAGAWGLTLKSVVHDETELRTQVQRLHAGLHGFNFADGGIFAERFIEGKEYTVFLTGSVGFPENRHVYPPLQRIFHATLPPEERFVTYERNWNKYDEETPLASNDLIFEERLVTDTAVAEMLQDLAWRAHCAVLGTGYSRVDIRVDEKTGRAFVLEVNANCSLSSQDDDTSTGYLLRFLNLPFSQIIGEILSDGLLRFFSKNPPSKP